MCLKAMAKDPADRYTTAADLAAALRATVAPKPRFPFAPRYLAPGALAVAAVLLVAVPFWNSRDETGDPGKNGAEPKKSTDAGEPPKVVPGAIRNEPDFKPYVDAWPDPVCLADSKAHLVLPLRDGDDMWFEATLAEPGHVYLFAGFHDKTIQLLCSQRSEVDPQTGQPRFKYPPPEQDEEYVLPVSGEHGYGAEMLLLAVSDKELSQSDLEELTRVPFAPSADVLSKTRRQAIAIPALETVRYGAPEPRYRSDLGASLYDSLEKFKKLKKFRSYRAILFAHAEPRPKPGGKLP